MSDLEQGDVSVGEPRHVAAQAAAVGVLRGHGLALARGEEVVSVKWSLSIINDKDNDNNNVTCSA